MHHHERRSVTRKEARSRGRNCSSCPLVTCRLWGRTSGRPRKSDGGTGPKYGRHNRLNSLCLLGLSNTYLNSYMA